MLCTDGTCSCPLIEQPEEGGREGGRERQARVHGCMVSYMRAALQPDSRQRHPLVPWLFLGVCACAGVVGVGGMGCAEGGADVCKGESDYVCRDLQHGFEVRAHRHSRRKPTSTTSLPPSVRLSVCPHGTRSPTEQSLCLCSARLSRAESAVPLLTVTRLTACR